MKDFDIYVVDNASNDGSADAIQKKYGGKIELLVNKHNLGGSGGFNTGLSKALNNGYKYLMCIDNDVLVDENAIGQLYNFLETHPKVGIVGSKVYQMDNPYYVQQFGINIDFKNYCVESKYFNYIEDGTMPDIVYSDAVAACSLMVRSSVVMKIGLMPEENFLYWDDTEWCYRCVLAGYKVASYGKSKVLHNMGAKKEVENTFPTYYAWRNWISFFIKYTPPEKLEEMTSAILGSLFNIVYESLYNGVKNKMKTVMYAYDDALHQISGKAAQNKIFNLEKTGDKLINIINGKKKIYINDNGYHELGNELFNKIKSIEPAAELVKNSPYDISFTICKYIFEVTDFSLKTVYFDMYDNIFATKEDAIKIFNYKYSKLAFIYAHQPLFLYFAKKIKICYL